MDLLILQNGPLQITLRHFRKNIGKPFGYPEYGERENNFKFFFKKKCHPLLERL